MWGWALRGSRHFEPMSYSIRLHWPHRGELIIVSLGDEYAILCGRGRPTDGKLTDALSGIVDSLWVATDDHAGYVRVAPFAWGLQAHGELSLVNAMQRRLYEFLLFFHGVFYEVAGVLVLPAFCG